MENFTAAPLGSTSENCRRLRARRPSAEKLSAQASGRVSCSKCRRQTMKNFPAPTRFQLRRRAVSCSPISVESEPAVLATSQQMLRAQCEEVHSPEMLQLDQPSGNRQTARAQYSRRDAISCSPGSISRPKWNNCSRECDFDDRRLSDADHNCVPWDCRNVWRAQHATTRA